MSTGLFFVRLLSIWITRAISFDRPITGSSLPARGGRSEVDAQLVERRRARASRALAVPLRHALVQDARCLGADLVQGDAQAFEDARGDAFAFPHDADEQVLRADVVMAQPARLVHRKLDYLLGAGREPDVARRGTFAPADDELHRRPDLRELYAEAAHHARGHPVGLSGQAKQNVLRPYVVVVKALCFLLCE